MRTLTRTLALLILAAAVVAVAPAIASAQAPPEVPLQGYLTDADGLAIDGATPLILTLYADGTEVYSEVQVVPVDNGSFVVYLGQDGLDLSLFQAGGSLALGITVGEGEELTPRFDLGTAPFAAFAQYAGDAATLGGVAAADYARADALEWTALENVPADLADGDSDTLADLDPLTNCNAGEVATWDGTAWGCAVAAPALMADAPVTLQNDTIGLQMGSGSGLDADTIDGIDSAAFADASHTHSTADIQGGTFPYATFDTFGDLGNEGRLDNNAGDDLLTRTQADNRFVNVGEAPSAHTHDGADITGGTIDPARFDAYDDLGTSGRLDNNAGADLLTRTQADGRYIQPGEANSITGAMIAAGAITNSDISDTAGISSDKINWTTPGSAIVSDCGTFVASTICPAGNNDMIGCDAVAPGGFCEADFACTNLDSSLDNCPGAYDIYIRTN